MENKGKEVMIVRTSDAKVNRRSRFTLKDISLVDMRSYTIVLAMLVLWIILNFLSDGAFFTPRNLSNLFRQGSVVAFIAVGMVLVIAAGQIDLSAGALA